jgi:hypothetical protein
MLLDVLTIAVLAFVGSRLLRAAGLVGRRDVRDHIAAIVRGVRPRHVMLAVPVLTAVATVASLALEVPGLDFGWWTAIGGEGNPVIGSTGRTRGTVLEWLVPLAFLVLLVPVLPLFAEREERMFRFGAEHWSTGHRIRRGVEFGLVHAIIGIPVGVALALSIGGWYFTWAYLRGYRRGDRDAAAGLAESTRAHLAYNGVVVVIVVVALLLTASG